MAVSFLLEKGYQVLERNWRAGRDGEIDIIAHDGMVLVFAEVKCRRSEKFGTPAQSVGLSKQRQVVRLARRYLYQTGLYGKTDCRFDVVSVRMDRGKAAVEHIPDAFRANHR